MLIVNAEILGILHHTLCILEHGITVRRVSYLIVIVLDWLPKALSLYERIRGIFVGLNRDRMLLDRGIGWKIALLRFDGDIAIEMRRSLEVVYILVRMVLI